MLKPSNYYDSYLDLIRKLSVDNNFVVNKKNIENLLSKMYSGVKSYVVFPNRSLLVLCSGGIRFLIEPVVSFGEKNVKNILHVTYFDCNDNKKVVFWVKRYSIKRFIDFLNDNKQLKDHYNGR